MIVVMLFTFAAFKLRRLAVVRVWTNHYYPRHILLSGVSDHTHAERTAYSVAEQLLLTYISFQCLCEHARGDRTCCLHCARPRKSFSQNTNKLEIIVAVIANTLNQWKWARFCGRERWQWRALARLVLLPALRIRIRGHHNVWIPHQIRTYCTPAETSKKYVLHDHGTVLLLGIWVKFGFFDICS